MNRALTLLLTVATPARIAYGQAQASLGIGVGTVRFPGGTSFSTAALSPAFQFTSPAFVANASGALASLPQGVWTTQGRADFWAATPPIAGGLRLGAEAISAGTTRSDGGWTSALHGVGELLWSAPTWGAGLGAGPSAGWIANEPSVVALHTRARAWWQPSAGTDWAVSVEPTRFLGAWFTDVTASFTMERGPVVGTVWAATRISSAYGSKGAASALLQFFFTPAVSMEIGGGSYLPDPYQGLPRAGYVTAGVRVHATQRAARTTAGPEWPPLVPELHGDQLTVRFRFDGARSVAIAGDWSAWRPVPLSPSGDGTWEGMLALSPGLYHFNLLVDGAEWVVPNGVATVSDGLGGLVGVLLIR